MQHSSAAVFLFSLFCFFFQNNNPIQQAKSLEDRISTANILTELDCCPLVIIDAMSDETNKAYGAVPERLYIILDGKIVYQGGVGPFFYNLNEVEDYLKEHTSEQKIEIA